MRNDELRKSLLGGLLWKCARRDSFFCIHHKDPTVSVAGKVSGAERKVEFPGFTGWEEQET